MGFGTLFNQKHEKVIAGAPFSFHFHFLNEKIQAKTAKDELSLYTKYKTVLTEFFKKIKPLF